MKLWQPPTSITICVAHERKVQPQAGYVFVRRRHLERLVREHPTLPRLRLEIALLEHASAQSTGGRALGVLADGCQQRLVTPARLRSALSLKPRLRWRRALLSILDDVAAGAYSFLEYAYLRKVERAHRLPTGRRQVPVDTPGWTILSGCALRAVRRGLRARWASWPRGLHAGGLRIGDVTTSPAT
jgi:hypothetical protein